MKISLNKKILAGCLITFLLFSTILVLLFLFGPLLPWSLIKPGFKKIETESVQIYYKEEKYLDHAEMYASVVENVIDEIEELYGLEQQSPVSVFVVDQGDLKRYIPWLNKGVGGATLQIGDTIYINIEKILETDRDPLEYLKHEMVHEIIYQNSGLLNAYRMMDTSLFTEGFPVFYGGPTYYEDRIKFLEEYTEKEPQIVVAREGAKAYTKIGETNSASFNYTLYGEFIQYLVDTYGQEAVNNFLHKWINQPDNFRSDFKEIFGRELYEVQDDFGPEL